MQNILLLLPIQAQPEKLVATTTGCSMQVGSCQTVSAGTAGIV